VHHKEFGTVAYFKSG